MEEIALTATKYNLSIITTQYNKSSHDNELLHKIKG